MEQINAVGRRKAAIARVFVKEGNGEITVNKRPLADYFPNPILQYIVSSRLTRWKLLRSMTSRLTSSVVVTRDRPRPCAWLSPAPW